ncbi:MAG: fumarylacetoacetate hydrolase family protein [Myxococcota bacterium]|nr:fumarylacetoacetate hydrolase family protein [Myxococcota bacterium]
MKPLRGLESAHRTIMGAPKIICLARTFAQHARELGNQIPKTPIYFLKASSAVIGPGECIRRPQISQEVHHEAEVAVWIGETLTNAGVADASKAIAGWTVLNDVTARDVQRADNGRFGRAKNFDTFCPLSDQVVHELNWADARIQCWVDGECRQDGHLSDLLYSPAEILSFLSQHMTLRTGDLVSLGTPAGVGPITHGQVVDIRLVDHSGETMISLANPVVDQVST